MSWIWLFLLKFTLIAGSLILIILVLLQKGKGGGLAGSLGGMGGQSAFGTKAGDLFTKITIGVAGVWLLVCVFGAMAAPNLGSGGEGLSITPTPGQGAPPNPGQTTPPASSGEKPAGSAARPGGEKMPEKTPAIPEPSSNPTEKPGK